MSVLPLHEAFQWVKGLGATETTLSLVSWPPTRRLPGRRPTCHKQTTSQPDRQENVSYSWSDPISSAKARLHFWSSASV
jgi:hypothetical protein